MPHLPVILFTAYADIDLAVRGIKNGATDFIVKPWDNQRLINVLLNATESVRKAKITPVDNSVNIFWGDSEEMKMVRSLIEKVAYTDASILITGENGTGKEVIAREIHRLSKRAIKEITTVDMGAISETLFESELFGHVKGAFTDAQSDRAGKFEQANGSTLFMDEIGNLPFHLQPKLLTVLQRREVVRVGGNNSIPIDIRLICATNGDLDEMIHNERFREDLLYRINTIHIEIPPLRNRKSDIIPLAHHFIKIFGERYGKADLTLSDDAMAKLTEYEWPGNIRELEHTIEKMVIFSEHNLLTPDVLHLPQKSKARKRSEQGATLEDMERNMIIEAIDRCAGNLSAVAMQLGITRQTLYNKMKKFGL